MRGILFLTAALALAACGGKSNAASGSAAGGSGSSSGTSNSSSGGTSPPTAFGTPTPVDQRILNPPTLLASDGVTLFWIDSESILWSEPVTGGGTPTQLAPSAAVFLYVDSTSVYFAAGSGFASIPKAGGTTSTLITASLVTASVTDGTVYWVEQQHETPPAPPQMLVKSAPLVAGGAVTTLGSFSSQTQPTAIAASGSAIFLSVSGAPQAIPTDGGATAVFSAGNCFSLVAGTDGVYCGDGTLTFVALDGTTTTTIAAEAADVASIALDATNVYWVNKTDSGSVATAPRNGGAIITVAYDANPLAVAVDDAAVYWSDAAGNLQRAAKQ